LLKLVPATKVCSACQQDKPAGEYYRRTDGRIFPRCKECTAKDQAERWKINKAQMAVLGYARDSIDVLQKGIKYLRKAK
jgi:hypothetical protein